MAEVSTGSGVNETAPKEAQQASSPLPTSGAAAGNPDKPATQQPVAQKTTAPLASTPPKGVVTTAAQQAAKVPLKPAVGVTPKFMIRTALDRVKWLKFLIYGPSGVGKTFLAGTASEVDMMQDVLFINIESGDLTLDPDVVAAFGNIDYIEARSFSIVARAYEFLKLHCQLRDADDEEGLMKLQTEYGIDPEGGVRRYRTVIIDSVTEIDQLSMDAVMNVINGGKIDADFIAPEWADFRSNLHKMVRFIKSFRDLPIHVVFVALASYQQDEQKRMIWSPQVTGQLSNKVVAFMDLVGYYVRDGVADKTVRRLQVQPTPKIQAKCRFSQYKKEAFDNPNMLKILQETGFLKKPQPVVNKPSGTLGGVMKPKVSPSPTKPK